MIAYLDFSVSTTGMLTGVKVRRPLTFKPAPDADQTQLVLFTSSGPSEGKWK